MKSQFEFLPAHTDCKLLDVCRSEKWVQTKTVEICTGIGVLQDAGGSLLSKCRTVLRYTRVTSFTPIRIVRCSLRRFSRKCHTISSLTCVSLIEFYPNRTVNVGSADRNSVMRRFLRNPQSLNSLSFLPCLHPLTTLRNERTMTLGPSGMWSRCSTFINRSVNTSLFHACLFCFSHLPLLWRQEGSCEMSVVFCQTRRHHVP